MFSLFLSNKNECNLHLRRPSLQVQDVEDNKLYEDL